MLLIFRNFNWLIKKRLPCIIWQRTKAFVLSIELLWCHFSWGEEFLISDPSDKRSDTLIYISSILNQCINQEIEKCVNLFLIRGHCWTSYTTVLYTFLILSKLKESFFVLKNMQEILYFWILSKRYYICFDEKKVLKGKKPLQNQVSFSVQLL